MLVHFLRFNMKKKNKVLSIILFIIYLVMLIFFIYECFQDGASAGKQAGFFSNIIAKIEEFFTGKEVIITDKYRYYVSKIFGHYGYFVLLGLVSIIFYMSLKNINIWIRISLHFGVALIYAFASEFIAEALTSGRTASIKDVGIDYLGFITISLPYVIAYFTYHYHKKKKEKEKE